MGVCGHPIIAVLATGPPFPSVHHIWVSWLRQSDHLVAHVFLNVVLLWVRLTTIGGPSYCVGVISVWICYFALRKTFLRRPIVYDKGTCVHSATQEKNIISPILCLLCCELLSSTTSQEMQNDPWPDLQRTCTSLSNDSILSSVSPVTCEHSWCLSTSHDTQVS